MSFSVVCNKRIIFPKSQATLVSINNYMKHLWIHDSFKVC